MRPADIAWVRQLVEQEARSIDWGALVDLAQRHKVIFLLAGNLLRLTTREFSMRFLLSAAYEANKRRNLALLRELEVILAEAQVRKLRVVFRKGAALLGSLYEDIGERYLGDLDLLVENDAAPRIAELLADLGYRQGYLSRDRRRVGAPSRAQQVFWQLHASDTHLQKFWRPTSEPEVEVFAVDVCLEIEPADETQVAITAGAIARARRARIGKSNAFVLTPEDALVDVSCHLHREATSLADIQTGLDLALIKFCDVQALCSLASMNWDVFAERVVRHRLQQPVYYALHFENVIYGDVVPEPVLTRLRPGDLAYLDEYGAADLEAPLTWGEDFMTRLFSKNRGAEAPPPKYQALLEAAPLP